MKLDKILSQFTSITNKLEKLINENSKEVQANLTTIDVAEQRIKELDGETVKAIKVRENIQKLIG